MKGLFAEMPKIDLDSIGLTAEELALAKGIVASARPSMGRLYTCMPRKAAGPTRYIWRMVAFHLSPRPKHHHVPIMAFTYLPGANRAERLHAADRLDKIVDKIVISVAVSQWAGLMAWEGLL